MWVLATLLLYNHHYILCNFRYVGIGGNSVSTNKSYLKSELWAVIKHYQDKNDHHKKSMKANVLREESIVKIPSMSHFYTIWNHQQPSPDCKSCKDKSSRQPHHICEENTRIENVSSNHKSNIVSNIIKVLSLKVSVLTY